jgi:hypothetical protein
MKSSVILLLSFLSIFSVHGKDLTEFNKRFKFIRDKKTNAVIAVKAKYIRTEFAIIPYLKQLQKDIKKQIIMAERGGVRINNMNYSYEAYVDAALNEIDPIQLTDPVIKSMSRSNPNRDNILRRKSNLKKSILNLSKVNIDQVMARILSTDVVTQYQSKLQKVFLQFRLDLIANLEDSRYFYRRHASHRVVTWALDYAKKKFSSVPILNTASFIIQNVDQLLREQRLISQNILLHYLENFNHKDLGLTENEKYKLWSSIYESRIPWTGLQESNKAAKNWIAYGPENFYKFFQLGSNRYRRVKREYEGMNRLNYAFAIAQDKEGKKVLNLQDSKHMFTQKPAIAIDYNKPFKIGTVRSLVRLGQIGLSFLPIPNFLKSGVNQFADSYYRKQSMTEGALIGYFESIEMQNSKKLLLDQIGNPFLQN